MPTRMRGVTMSLLYLARSPRIHYTGAKASDLQWEVKTPWNFTATGCSKVPRGLYFPRIHYTGAKASDLQWEVKTQWNFTATCSCNVSFVVQCKWEPLILKLRLE